MVGFCVCVGVFLKLVTDVFVIELSDGSVLIWSLNTNAKPSSPDELETWTCINRLRYAFELFCVDLLTRC
jgi:hypothetical protein